VLAGGVAVAIALALLAGALLSLSRRLPRRVGIAWRFGLNNLLRRTRTSIGQILAFGLALMAMAVIVLLRTDLLTAWQTQLQPDTPNYFAFNILPQDVPATQGFFTARGIQASADLSDGARTADGNQRGAGNPGGDQGGIGIIMRCAANSILPGPIPCRPDNALVRGVVVVREGRSRNSVSGLRSGWRKNSAITALAMISRSMIAGEPLNARVASIRSVQWDSFHPNFYNDLPAGTAGISIRPPISPASICRRTGRRC